jgi:hypothetical protein
MEDKEPYPSPTTTSLTFVGTPPDMFEPQIKMKKKAKKQGQLLLGVKID